MPAHERRSLSLPDARRDKPGGSFSLVMIIALLGCVLAARRGPNSASGRGEPPPEKDKSAQSARTVTAEKQAALEEGQALYRGLCSGCHGGAGRGGKGPDLTRKKFIHGDADEDIIRVIKNGVPKTTMKKLGDSLKDDQIAKLLLFIRSLSRAPGESTWKPY